MAKNPLFNVLEGNRQTSPVQNFMTRFQQFRNNMQGDPRQQIQRLLDSGRITQEQYNNAVMMAQQIQQLLK